MYVKHLLVCMETYKRQVISEETYEVLRKPQIKFISEVVLRIRVLLVKNLAISWHRTRSARHILALAGHFKMWGKEILISEWSFQVQFKGNYGNGKSVCVHSEALSSLYADLYFE